MPDNPFRNPDQQPDEGSLQSVLAAAYPAYTQITALAEGFRQEWSYAKYSGWVLKISDRKKALLYLIPDTGGFALSMALRPEEREALLGTPELAFAAGRLETAKQYKEGFALRLELPGDDLTRVLAFLSNLIQMRTR